MKIIYEFEGGGVAIVRHWFKHYLMFVGSPKLTLIRTKKKVSDGTS